MGRSLPLRMTKIELERQSDVVSSIYDLKKIERLALKHTPARPNRRLVTATPPTTLSVMLKRFFVFGYSDLVMPYRDEWVAAFNSTQLPDGSWPAAPYACPYCPQMSSTGVVTSAYWHLGARPRRRIQRVEKLLNERALTRWLGALNWGHPWGGAGHECIGLTQIMANIGLGTRGAVQTIFDFVNAKMRQQRTGLIAKGHFKTAGDQQFGSTYAFGIIFEFFKADFPWADRLVEFILARQHASGSWSKEFPGGSYNMDAAFLLSRWTRHGSKHRPDAQAALRRLAQWLKKEVAKLHGEEQEKAVLQLAPTLLLLQEVLPSRRHTNRIWRYNCDLTINPW